MRAHGVVQVQRQFLSPSPSTFWYRSVNSVSATRYVSSSLGPFIARKSPLDRRWQQRRGQAGAAAALYISHSPFKIHVNRSFSLEQAQEPENLAQETIINNLAPKEAQRLSRVRNIGIAVGGPLLKWRKDN